MQSVSLINNTAPLYEPLESDQIRVLYVWPSEDYEAPLQALLVTQRPTEEPYNALSYVWGDTRVTERITVDSHPFEVTTNLAAGLRQLRSTTDMLAIWVDAICINQYDLDERSQQVRNMHHTYITAKQVYVWLGPAADDSDRAFEFVQEWANTLRSMNVWRADDPTESTMKRCLSEVTIDTQQYPHNSRSYWYIKDEFRYGRGALHSSANWYALESLMSRPWWHRLWTLQEAVLARSITIRCGSASLPWDDIYAAEFLALFWTFNVSPRSGMDDVDIQRVLHLKSPTELMHYREETVRSRGDGIAPSWMKNPLLLTNQLACKMCSDPRDKLFAMASLLGRVDFVSVDYKKTTEDVYRDFAKDQIVYWTPSLNVLGYAGLGRDRETTTLPSWVPDWRDFGPERRNNSLTPVYHAAKWFVEPFAKHPVGNRLTVPWFSYDIVEDVENSLGRGLADLDTPASGVELIWDRPGLYVTGCSHFHALVRCRLEDTALNVGESGVQRIGLQHAEYLAEYVLGAMVYLLTGLTVGDDSSWNPLGDNADINRKLQQIEDLPPFLGLGSVFPWSPRVHTSMLNSITQWPPEADELRSRPIANANSWRSVATEQRKTRRLFRTAQGYLGAGPLYTQSGDFVCVLFGGKTPFLLRKRQSLPGYVLVGDTYVHGIMDGEALDERNISSPTHPDVSDFDVY